MTDKLTEIHAQLEQGLAELTTSEQWQAHLDMAARFHHYSPNNVLLLLIQASERDMNLSRVAGYQAWLRLGRQVRRGERALKVLAPCRYKTEDPNTGDEHWAVRGFRVASVFDISQTDGEPLDEVTPAMLNGATDMVGAVVSLVRERGYTFTLVDPATLNGANGMTDFSASAVVVRNDTEPAQTLKTACHELAHVMLHAPDLVDRATLTRETAEIQAESVAYVVLGALGIDAAGYTLPYVAGWSGGDVAAVKATADTVVKTAHQIVNALTVADTETVAA